MQNKIKSIQKILFTLLLITFLHYGLFAQGGDSISSRGKELFFGLSLGPTRSLIKNNGTSSIESITSDKVNAFDGAAEVGYFFSRYIGLSSGIGFSSYGSLVKLDTYQNKLNAIDSENEAYELRVTGTNIKETQSIKYLYVPVYLNLRLPLTGKIGVFLQSGVNLAFAVNNKYTTEGTFTYKGYYSKYNVLLENLPIYGFPTNKAANSSGSPEVKPFTAFVVAAGGFDYFINDKLQLAIMATWNKSLSEVSAYSANTQFQLTPAVDQINSFMGGSSSVTAESIGLSVRIRYFLKL